MVKVPCRHPADPDCGHTVAGVPFTASHVAAVLPVVRTPLVPSALVVGSVVPDQAVLFPVPLYAGTHSLPGVFALNPAVGFAVLVTWHLLLTEPLYAMTPPALRRRLPVPNPRALLTTARWPRRLLLSYASLVLGAATHVGWDEFTHPNRWGSQRIEWLAETQGPLLGTTWAQYASSLLGAVIVAAWLTAWWRRTPPRAPAVPHEPVATLGLGRTASWAIWLIPLAAGGGVSTAVGRAWLASGTDSRRTAFWVAASGTSTCLTVVVLLALGWHVRRVLLSSANTKP